MHAIDAVEALGIDPAEAAPEHWRYVHNRLSVGEQPRSYTLSQHKAQPPRTASIAEALDLRPRAWRRIAPAGYSTRPAASW